MTTKEIIINAINEELSKLDCSNICVVIKDYADDFIAKNFAMGLADTEKPFVKEVETVRNTLAGVSLCAEVPVTGSGKDTVFYFIGAIQYTYENYYDWIRTQNDGKDLSLEECIRQLVRHEWRHCQQFSKIREAGYGDIVDIAGTAEFTAGYMRGPLEVDAWRFQKGDEQSWEDFVHHFANNWNQFEKLIQDQGSSIDDLKAQRDEYFKQLKS